jgi:iron complex transport system ATP-binding protein
VEPVLELREATLVRGRNTVLDGLSLTVRRGEHTVILGPNGAGKSSLIRLLTLEDRPRVTVDGVPPLRLFGRAAWDVGELRTRLGVVTGELDARFGLHTSRGRVCGLDVAVSGLFGSHGLFAHHEVTDEMREQGRRALARMEAAHVAAAPLSEMSAGERRRTLIARALVTRPDALVLDEPTTGLDLVARHRFLETIRRLAADGTTVVLVTHHVDEIIPETRKVVLLVAGRILHEGPPEDTLTPEWLEEVFGAPVSVARAGGYYQVRVRR